MYFVLTILKMDLIFIYFFLKLLPTNNKKVIFISRQSNRISLDFQLLQEEIYNLNPNYKVVLLCNKVDHSFKGIINYYLNTLKHLYHLATAKVCIVDSYCLAVSIPKHKKDLIIIQIWHAIATVKKFGYQTLGKEYGRDKKISEILNMHKNYDWVISGSDAMKSIFSQTFNVDISKIKSIGTPRIDFLLKNNIQMRQKIINKYPKIIDKKVILYAPTFRRDKTVDINQLINTIDFTKYNLIVKFHPVNKQKINNDKVYNCKEFSSLQLLSVADYVITDYSAISIEASILNKPVYFYVYDIDEYQEKNGLNINLYNEMGNVCFKKINDLYKAIETEKYNYNKLNDFKNKYVTNQNGNSGYLLAHYIVNGIWLDSNKTKTKYDSKKKVCDLNE